MVGWWWGAQEESDGGAVRGVAPGVRVRRRQRGRGGTQVRGAPPAGAGGVGQCPAAGAADPTEITPSTILRKLGTYSKKNRLYQAFRELGVAVRTGFLLRYLGDAELRATIQAATNKSESFNEFVQWLAFGGGVIAENDRVEQRKVIKYNHLLANCLIFHNAWTMTRVLHQLQVDGVSVDAEAVAALSPYIRTHINRFGRYQLDLSRIPPAVDYDLPILAPADAAAGHLASAADD